MIERSQIELRTVVCNLQELVVLRSGWRAWANRQRGSVFRYFFERDAPPSLLLTRPSLRKSRPPNAVFSKLSSPQPPTSEPAS